MSSNGDGETAPLLQPHPHSEIAERGNPAINRKFILIWTTFLIFLLDFGVFLSVPAQNVIFEKIICQHYVATLNGTVIPDGLPPFEDPCKSTRVQSELGEILGWKDTFEVIPGILVGLFWGMLGDHWGRIPICFLALLGGTIVESGVRVIAYWPEIFPLRAVWYIQFFFLLGGGYPIAQSMVFTIITDVTNAAERADVFVVLYTAILISEIIALPLGAALMEATSPWVPYIAGPGLLGLGTALIWVLPETLPQPDPSIEEEPTAQRIKAAPQLLWANLTLACIIFVYFVSVLSRQTSNFIVLYASKKFSWTLARASYLLSLRSVTHLVLLLLILPFLTRLLMDKHSFSTPRKDLFLIRLQSCVIVIGTLLVAFSGHPWSVVMGVVTFSLGSGFSINTRSLATTLVRREHFASTNTALAISQSLGIMTAGPMLAASWKKGLTLGGSWLGLPFLVAGGLFALVSAVTWTIRLRKERDEGEEEARGEEEVLVE